MGEGRTLPTGNYFSVAKENVNRRSALAETLCFIFPFVGWVDLGRLNCVLFLFLGFPSSCRPITEAIQLQKLGLRMRGSCRSSLPGSWRSPAQLFPTPSPHQSAARELEVGGSRVGVNSDQSRMALQKNQQNHRKPEESSDNSQNKGKQ